MKRIVCDTSKKTGKIKPQHGAVNWPYNIYHAENSNDAADCDRVKEIFREINFPLVRLKEPYNGGYVKCLEVPFIFRDFAADENDPKNYFFPNTKSFVRNAAKDGIKIIIRLGAPRELYGSKYNGKPEDFEKFARICKNIVRHINDGWANGLHAGVKYFEIWNRADDIKCWPCGDISEYYRLYEAVAREIKALHPRLKVGGPAAAFCGGDNAFLKGFLSYVTENSVPCDFVTWNYFGEDAAEAARQAKEVRRLVKESRLPSKTEIFNDEWNDIEFDENGFAHAVNTRNEKGAAFAGAFMSEMQKAKMDGCTYYEINPSLPWGGLIGRCHKKAEKPLYAFLMFSRLYRLGESVKVTKVGRNLYTLGASDGTNDALMIAVCEDKKNDVEIAFNDTKRRKVYIVDRENDFAEISDFEFDKIALKTKGHTLIFVESV